ncbi:hypothetical protein [Nonomuraea sp. NPDC023979]|uniref:hypothetical protein n=1 Tax=Nonomuraea sp. NPDC023979 TaxID=3154796 RepID=UPI0033CE8AAD
MAHPGHGSALIVADGQDAPLIAVDLPLPTQQAVDERVEALREARLAAIMPGLVRVRQQAQQDMFGILASLWEAVAAPVLDAAWADVARESSSAATTSGSVASGECILMYPPGIPPGAAPASARPWRSSPQPDTRWTSWRGGRHAAARWRGAGPIRRRAASSARSV